MKTDNSHHLLAAARHRSDKARQQVEEALKQLSQTTQPATVSELARRSGVSRSWLYTQPDLLEQLQRRKLPAKMDPTGSNVRASEASIHRRLELAYKRIRQLTDENKRLEERLARAHGALREARH